MKDNILMLAVTVTSSSIVNSNAQCGSLSVKTILAKLAQHQQCEKLRGKRLSSDHHGERLQKMLLSAMYTHLQFHSQIGG